MSETKQVMEVKLMAMPPLRWVLADPPATDAEAAPKLMHSKPSNKEMQIIIRKLIEYLKEDK